MEPRPRSMLGTTIGSVGCIHFYTTIGSTLGTDEGIAMPATLASRHVRLSIHEVVAELAAVLGAPLVAALGEVRDTRSVRQWISNEASPKHDHRLRFALQVVDLIRTREPNDVVRAWFAGMEPNLDDENPIMLLVKHDDTQTRRRILEAARQFISEVA